jgi:hypothetical protein
VRLLAIGALVLAVAAQAEAQSRWEQCLATKTCKAEVDRAIAEAVEAAEARILATIPCVVFARSRAEAEALVEEPGTVCLVVHGLTKRDGDYHGRFVDR